MSLLDLYFGRNESAKCGHHIASLWQQCVSVVCEHGAPTPLPCWYKSPHTYHRSPRALTVSLRALGGWRQTARLTNPTFNPPMLPFSSHLGFRAIFFRLGKEMKNQGNDLGVKMSVSPMGEAGCRSHAQSCREGTWSEVGPRGWGPRFLPCHSAFLWELVCSWKWRDKIWCFWLACGVQGCVWPPPGLLSCLLTRSGFPWLTSEKKMTFTCDEELQSDVTSHKTVTICIDLSAVSLSGKLSYLI